ncbi:MAG: glycosyl hydrolase family 65 protein, partial [Phycisphaerales bacterium]
IAFNVWQYYQATDDEEFLSFYGAEMILDIARFWASIASWNPDRDRYDIHSVVGPDEFQTQDPNSDEPGLTNNAYTNIMAAWTIRCARRALHAIPDDRVAELREQLDISEEDLKRWDHIAANLYVPFHEDGIISQFEGYEELKEFDWDGYHQKYDDIQRLDRILESEDDSPNNYKASKQADVLMLFYLFSAEELAGIFEQLGYEFDEETIPRNIRYYNKRTSHGSTLSRVVSVWVQARARRDTAWSVFENALESDVKDIQGGTTSEGIHLGAMAGTVDIMQRCYTGMEIRDDVLWFAPFLPPDLSDIHFVMRFRGHTLSLEINHEQIKISSCKDGPRPIKIGINGRVAELYEGHTRTEKLETTARSST